MINPFKKEMKELEQEKFDIKEIEIIQSFEGNTLAGINPNDFMQIKLAIKIGVK